ATGCAACSPSQYIIPITHYLPAWLPCLGQSSPCVPLIKSCSGTISLTRRLPFRIEDKVRRTELSNAIRLISRAHRLARWYERRGGQRYDLVDLVVQVELVLQIFQRYAIRIHVA